jgi:energy-coupling factor transport system permease protein
VSGLRLVSATTGTSWLHRMSPVPKLAWMTAGVVISLVTYDLVPLLFITTAAVVAAASAGVGGALARTLLAFGPLAASILVIQALAPTSCLPACTTVASVGPLTFYEEGIIHGMSLVARLLAMEVVAFTVLLTTHPSDLFAGLEMLRVPRSICFAASMTLQLVPILEREFALVLGAQRARGLRSSGPSALGRAIVPVVVAAVERVQQLSISLEARGFGGTIPRTSYREVVFRPADGVLALAGVFVGIAGAAAGLAWWGPGSTASVEIPAWLAVAMVAVAGAVFIAVLARAVALVLRA